MGVTKAAAFARTADTTPRESTAINAKTDTTGHTESTGMKPMSAHVSHPLVAGNFHPFTLSPPQLATATTSTRPETAPRKPVTANAESNSKRPIAILALRDISATPTVVHASAISTELKDITVKPPTESARASQTLAETSARNALQATTDILTANVRLPRGFRRRIALTLTLPQLASATIEDRMATRATSRRGNAFAGRILLANTATSARTATTTIRRVLVSISRVSF
jgi:hypothetical protein